MKQKYFENNINGYDNPNAQKLIKKYPYVFDYFVLGFINNGNAVLFMNDNMYEEKEKIPYFYVQTLDGYKFKVNYKLRLMNKEFKSIFTSLKNEIVDFMNLKFKDEKDYNAFSNYYLYSYFDCNWQLRQLDNKIFSKLYWNNKFFYNFDKKYFLSKKIKEYYNRG